MDSVVDEATSPELSGFVASASPVAFANLDQNGLEYGA